MVAKQNKEKNVYDQIIINNKSNREIKKICFI